MQMHFRIGACEESIPWVRKVNLRQKSAGSSANSLGRAHYLPWELLPGKFGECDVCDCLASFHGSRIFFGDIHIYAQSSCLCDVKEIRLWPRTAACIDEVTDVGVARGDHSIKRGVYLFKRHQCLVTLYVSLVRFDDCLVCIVRTDGIVNVLLSNGVLLQ